MDSDVLRDRLNGLAAALADIDGGHIHATPGERAYITGALDVLVALLSEN